MKYTLRFLFLLAVAASFVAAQDKPAKPNFSGEWLMEGPSDDSQKSGTDQPFMRVEHAGTQLKVTIASSSRSTSRDVWSLTTDSVENINRMNGTEVKSKTRWQGDSLITEWVTQNNGKPMPHRQVWSLSPDGKRLTLAMRDGDNENTISAVKLPAGSRP